jgi:CRISPR/Cas system Type II protein with McrA/HNH and RuvC-like nuclease domain
VTSIWGKQEKQFRLHRAQNGLCALCGDDLKLAEATFDHIIPKSKHGPSTIDNLQLAHRSCNNKKGDKIVAPLQLSGKIRKRVLHALVMERLCRRDIDERKGNYIVDSLRQSGNIAGSGGATNASPDPDLDGRLLRVG